jgi:hypothetical protein
VQYGRTRQQIVLERRYEEGTVTHRNDMNSWSGRTDTVGDLRRWRR